MRRMDVMPGRPTPLGATYDGRGVNFAVYSEHARRMEVCLFDPAEPSRELRRVPLLEQTGHVWHGYVPGLAPGALYGLRAHGRYEPRKGLRFNGTKLLVDPYARALVGAVDFRAPIHGYVQAKAPEGAAGATPEEEVEPPPDLRDSAPGVPRGVVLTDAFDWGQDRAPRTPWHRSLIYELHVKGFTKLHPGVPEPLRGTYAGLAHPAAIEHLQRLGVTAVELLP